MGISRHLPYQNNKDGVCDEIINARRYKGRLEPIGTKTKLYNLPSGTFNDSWVHDQDNVFNFIGQDSDNNLKLINPSDGSSTLIKAYSGSVNVEFVKRFMIVIYSGGMDIFLWKDDTYSLIAVPSRPRLTYFASATKDYTADSGGDAAEILSQYYEKVNEASNENYHTGGIMFRAAIKMFDGSYVLHSLPEFLSLGLHMTLGPGLPGVHFTGAKVSISLSPLHFLGIDKDIFTSVVIFACKNEELYQMDEDGLTDDMLTAAGAVYPIEFETLFSEVNQDFKKMADSIAWYKVHEFDMATIQEGVAAITEEVKLDGFYQDYATREVLPVDQFSHHSLSGAVSFNYNSRLILGNITTKFGNYAYYPLNPYLLGVGDQLIIPTGFTFSENLPVKLLVTLNTNSGQATKLIDAGERPFFTKDGGDATYKIFTLCESITGYPDARASKIEIFVKKSGSWYNIKSINLTKSLYWNYSYYIPEYFSVDPYLFYESLIFSGFLSTSYNYYFQTYGSNFPSEQQINIEEYSDTDFTDTNRVQVSEVKNPLYFKAENSYQCGTGKIIGIATNTEPLSSGQFGQYPLIIFTSKGIGALLQGSGSVLFASYSPVNGEVANSGSIVSVGHGVVYTTEKGIFLIQGMRTTELSTLVTGSPNTDFQANPNYQFYINDVRLTTLKDHLSTTDILEYLSGAKLGFDKKNNELYVTNSNYSYSYIYNFEADFWFKIPESFRLLINYYPKLLTFRESGTDTGIIDLSTETRSSYIQVLLTTQPMKFETDTFKVIKRMVLRTRHETETGTYSGFYYFGSSDLINWQRITGRNHISGKKRDILLQRSGSMFKYFVVVFSGRIKQDSYIGDLDIIFQHKLNNKLR